MRCLNMRPGGEICSHGSSSMVTFSGLDFGQAGSRPGGEPIGLGCQVKMVKLVWYAVSYISVLTY